MVKKIVSKTGIVHFKRYRLLSLPKFNIYIHNIKQSDLDLHMHDHPWHFISFILKGIYREDSKIFPNWKDKYIVLCPGDFIKHHAKDSHKLTLLTDEVWTLVFTWGKKRLWGYHIDNDTWINHLQYRKLKNEGSLPI